MAPPPEYDKEPKAPDKTVTNISADDSKILYNHIKEQPTNPDHKTTAVGSIEVQHNKHVETLDDGQLRALLDEAITYKCPKDREGKSILFKNLLQEVEQDEQEECEAAARGIGAGRSNRRGRGRREHHSSLQDLVAAMAGEQAPRRGRAHAHSHAHTAPPAASVSARAHHGGSLPSGVDTSSLLSEDASIGCGSSRGGYLATVRCVNPPPLAERRVSAGDANPPDTALQQTALDESLNRRNKPMFPMTYTARATLEIGSGSVCSGRAVTTTTASNQVDSAIPFSCITSPEVVASCNTTSSTSQGALAVDPKPLQLESCYRAVACLTGESALATPPSTQRSASDSDSHGHTALSTSPARQPLSVISSSFNGLPLSRPGYSSATSSNTDEYKKSLDENGNAVQGFSSPLSGSSQFKKPRRKKSTKNETVIKSHQIDGYQGNKDINEVLRFIESNADGARGPKLRAKHKDDYDDKTTKKRSTERRKDKEPKLKRASSLEELSRTTLADLTHPAPAATATVAARRGPPPAKPERRSWGDDARALLSDPDPAPQELTDFQTVTKKRKPRRRADDPDPDPLPRRHRAPPAPPSATPSAPPSDRSNDSNDDMDSVHSLSNAPPPPPPLPPPPIPPPPPVPHASYADIARTRQNIPDLIESCNFYVESEVEQRPDATVVPASGGGVPTVSTAGDGEQSPVLAERSKQLAAPAPVLRKERTDVTRPTEPAAPAPAPDVVADRRPPVILLDSAARPGDMDGVTFGFDINEQLLSGTARRAHCDLLRDAELAHAHTGDGAGEVGKGALAPSVVETVAVSAGCSSLRYVPPGPPRDMVHLHQIIDYVGAAWEDVVRCVASSGKVRYFSE